jgi:hypothetical protein
VAYKSYLAAGDAPADGVVSPRDIAGIVTRVSPDGEALKLIVETRAGNRRASVSGIVVELMPRALSEGEAMTLYSLETSEIRGRGQYIANFHAWSRPSPANSAYSALIVPGL